MTRSSGYVMDILVIIVTVILLFYFMCAKEHLQFYMLLSYG